MAVWYAAIPPCTPDSHTYRITSIKCCINTVVSPDDGHIVARNMESLINILKNIVHQVGFIYNIIQGCKVNKTNFQRNFVSISVDVSSKLDSSISQETIILVSIIAIT